MARAAVKSPRSAASTSCDISMGISFDTTAMTPRPPTAISGSVKLSSPDSTMKSAGTARQTSHICAMLPDASLMPTMFDTDWIDLYQMHRPPVGSDIEEALGALTDLVHQG